MKLKEITDDSWIVVSDSNDNIALLSKTPRKKYTLLAKDAKTTFSDEDEVERFFETRIFDKVIKKENQSRNKENFIDGYPASYENPVPVKEKLNTELPVYAKSEESSTYHCAGYYCINFPKGWLGAFCPRLDTLDKYGYRGPFREDLEMKSTLSILKKKDR